MKFKELKEKSRAELEKLLATERAHWRDLRFQVAAEQEKQVHKLSVSRRTIARILTLLKSDKLENKPRQQKSDSNLSNEKNIKE